MKQNDKLQHEREMKGLELNSCRIINEKSMAMTFALGENVRLGPPFNESEVDKYFLAL